MKYFNSLRRDTNNYIKDIFQKAYDYAVMFTTCNKLPVGCIILDEDGNSYYGSNTNYSETGAYGEYNCKLENECYKAKTTGVYESCEKTRKYCKATHSEINAIRSMKHSLRKRFDSKVSTAIMYVTRYPCVNCANEIVNAGIKTVNYGGIQEISTEVKKIFDEAGVIYTHYPEYDFEGESIKDYKWWTVKFAEKAYNIVKNRKFPVTIPGYNRPALPTLWNFGVDKFNDEKNWNFIVIVRESQYDMYMKATESFRKWVTIKSFPDEVINNAGAVRRTTQKWLNSQGIEATFQMDDDVQYLGWSCAGRKEDGYPKSQYIRPKDNNYNVCDALAMWQLAMEKAMKEYDIFISCGQQIAFSWKEDYCWKESSMQLMCGPMTQVVCFNIKRLCEEGIYHNNNVDVGFDDIDFTIRVINSGHKVCCFPWLVYGCEALGGGNGDKATKEKLQERFKHNQEVLKSNHSDKPFVKFRVKRDLDQCCLDFRAARKFLNESYDYPEEFIKANKVDIWEDGGLINENK